jgi:hypothetical protein
VVVHEAARLLDGHVTLTNKPGLGIELNADVVKAHLAEGETWWGRKSTHHQRDSVQLWSDSTPGGVQSAARQTCLAPHVFLN